MSPDNSTSSVADRNLLFGILELQMDFIDREALIASSPAQTPESTIDDVKQARLPTKPTRVRPYYWAEFVLRGEWQ